MNKLFKKASMFIGGVVCCLAATSCITFATSCGRGGVISNNLLDEYLLNHRVSLPTPVSPNWDTVDNEQMIEYFNENLTTQIFINAVVGHAAWINNNISVAQDQGENVGFYLDLFDVQSEANNGMTIRIKYTVFSESRTLNEDFWYSFNFVSSQRLSSPIFEFSYIDYSRGTPMRVDYLGLLKKVGIKIETGDPILGDYPVLRTEFFDEGENITFPLTDVKMNDIQNIFSFLPYYEE